MNPTVYTIYREYLDKTGQDAGAAAALTLADVMQNIMDAQPADAPASAKSAARPDDAPLTVYEAAARLRLSPKTLYAMCARGDLPSFRAGRSVRIAAAEVARFEKPQPTRSLRRLVGKQYV
jgi:excisionase family DNA binding protein